MSAPAWLAGSFAALMIMIAACCAARLAVPRLRGRNTERDADALHGLMGMAMAGMLEPRLTPVPVTAWRAVFAAAAAWFAWQAIRPGRRAGGHAPTRRPTPSNAPPWSTCCSPSAPGPPATAQGWRCPA